MPVSFCVLYCSLLLYTPFFKTINSQLLTNFFLQVKDTVFDPEDVIEKKVLKNHAHLCSQDDKNQKSFTTYVQETPFADNSTYLYPMDCSDIVVGSVKGAVCFIALKYCL